MFRYKINPCTEANLVQTYQHISPDDSDFTIYHSYTRFNLALALNVITVIFTFVECTHFMLIKNRSPTY